MERRLPLHPSSSNQDTTFDDYVRSMLDAMQKVMQVLLEGAAAIDDDDDDHDVVVTYERERLMFSRHLIFRHLGAPGLANIADAHINWHLLASRSTQMKLSASEQWFTDNINISVV